jgi:hypothetical protein
MSLAETLTVTRLGTKLLETVESTNPIESMIEIVGDHATRGETLELSDKALRWATAGMLAAQTQFRRVKGYQQLPQLALTLERATAPEPGMLDLPSARGGPPRRGRRPGPVHQPPRQRLTVAQPRETESSTYTALA